MCNFNGRNDYLRIDEYFFKNINILYARDIRKNEIL